jgi:chaperone required for assembly of F1-ATPase
MSDEPSPFDPSMAATTATRVARAAGAEPLKRFYTAVDVRPVAGGFEVTLDGRATRTPAKAPQILPTRALGDLVAGEWSAQGPHVLPATMAVTRLVNVVLDRAAVTREAMADEVVRYAGTDLVCYRASGPAGLVDAQERHWDPALAWAGERGIVLGVTRDAVALAQPAASLAAARALATGLDDWHLTVAAFATGLAGSAVLGLMVAKGAMDADAAFAAIRIEEEWNARIWGRDPEDTAAAAGRLRDLKACAAVVAALAD